MIDSKKPKNGNKNSTANSNNAEDGIFRDFIDSMKDFKALHHTKHNPFETKPETYTINSHQTNDEKLNSQHNHHSTDKIQELNLSEHLWRPEVSSEENLFHFQQGVQYRTIRKIRSGKIRIEASLDLHQLNKEQARIEFSNFIIDCYEQEKRCICIIHGKGNRSSTNLPILKNLVNHWLQDVNIVLGFCSCPENMGGTGAVLVLLKRSD